jgi:Skp family chaperone for outer membrane proteins
METDMKPIVLLFGLMLAIAQAGGAFAQSAPKVVTPATPDAATRAATDAVGAAAKDALKSDKKAEEADKMKKKVKAAEDALKKGSK